MADFVGREITAIDDSGLGDHSDIHNSFTSRAGRTTIGTDDVGHDVTRLYALIEHAMMNAPAPAGDEAGAGPRPREAARAREMLRGTWQSIRDWLAAHPSELDRRQAATHQGQFLTTALHMACKLADPPPDVISGLIDCASETVTWPDSSGWLPLHHACANGASGRVLSVLVQAYPEGKVQQDKRLRTPLHFAFFRKDAAGASGHDGMGAHGNKEYPNGGGGDDGDDGDEVGNSMPEIVQLLADSGAAELQEEGGLLPMHYASAYGTTREVLEVLYQNYPECITKRENKGRNALHLAMVNAHRDSSPGVVGFLLEKNAAEIINKYDDDHHLPIHLLAMASKFPPEKVTERKNAAGCLKLYLNAKPKASADFLTAIQTLPEWLRDIAVINEHIQDILNLKIVMRFPTMILILDALFLILAITFFELASSATIDWMFDPSNYERVPMYYVFGTLICGIYFLVREVVQVVSLVFLGNLRSWVSDIGNWLDVLVFSSIFALCFIMLEPETSCPKEVFRGFAAVAKMIMWLSFISFLKSVRVQFSVFVSGVYYVVQKLTTYILSLVIILLAFANMFLTVYTDSPECNCTKNNEGTTASPFPHCTFKDSMLKVYTMLMGEIGDEMRYSTNNFAWFLYMAFAFLVVILLSNVLIAIVTDSYGVVKNERSAMVFWSNRLDFVAEMDAYKNVGKIFLKCFKQTDGAAGAPMRVQERPNGEPIHIDDAGSQSQHRMRDAWESIMNLFGPNLYEAYDTNPSSFEFWCYFVVRVVAVVIIPLWIVIGLGTAGWLWPPQVREYLFKQKSVAISRADVAEQVTAQINDLKQELKNLRLEMRSEMKNDRMEFTQVKDDVVAVQAEVMADLLQVKEIMMLLLNMSKERMGPVR